MKLYTIGFTQKTAEEFFTLLAEHGVTCVVDVRVHTGGQLAGFAKEGDLAYFLKTINNCCYVHLLALAPTEEMMRAYRASGDYEAYRSAYNALLDARGVPTSLDRALFENNTCCLLCSEAKPDGCHRKLAAERMREAWGEVEVEHL